MIGFVQPTLLINHLQRFPKISCNTWKQEGSWSYCWIRKLSNPKTFSPFHSVQIYISTSAPDKKNLKNIRRTRMLHLLGYSMLNNQLEFYRKNILGENHYLTTFLPTSFYFLSWNVTDFLDFGLGWWWGWWYYHHGRENGCGTAADSYFHPLVFVSVSWISWQISKLQICMKKIHQGNLMVGEMVNDCGCTAALLSIRGDQARAKDWRGSSRAPKTI